MFLHLLQPAQGSVHRDKRLGRGEASGKGGTSTKGNKGSQQHPGHKYKIGHEGGQMPLQRRIPKRGFKNNNRIEYVEFNLSQLDYHATKHGLTEFSLEVFKSLGLIGKSDKVKVLGDGETSLSFTLKVNAITKSAKEKLSATGSSIELVKH